MAYDYEKAKQLYQGMNREQQQQFVDQNKNDASFQRFMGDYMNEINGKSQKATPVQNNEQKPLQQNSEQKPLQQQQQDEVVTNKNQYAPEEFKNQNNQQFDPNEKLQTQMFQTPANDKVVVKEGTAQQTGTPDYQLDSDARNKEITDNLNYYWQNNQDYFKDRATYNSIFHYDERSEGQKAILDSYWKKKDLQDSTIKYGTGDSIVQGMNDIDITEDQLNYIKANNEGAYREWQAKQQEMIDRIISNQNVPTVDEIVNKLTDYIDKLDLGSQRYDFMQYNEELKQQYQIDSKLSALEGTIANMKSDKAKIDSVITKYSNAGADTMGGAAANFARMQRALAPYNESFAKNAQIYSAQLQSYQMSAAQVKSDLNVMYQQTQEDQRVWNNQLKALGFAMDVDSYRTPEQQMNLRLQEQYQKGQISLLQQSQEADLKRYSSYADAKMQSQLEFELSDLNVADPQQQKINLNNVLSRYYAQYGDIIKRSQSQTLNDIMEYAQKNGVSVAEALTKNFIEPLQSKPEYKSQLAETYGMNKYQSQYSYTIDEDGNVSIKASGYGEIPQSAFTTREKRQEAYNDVYNYTDQNRGNYIECLTGSIKEGSYGGQCGAFVNDVLQSGGNSKVFGNYLSDKIKSCNVTKEEGPQVGYAVVMDFNKRVPNEDNTANVNYGHVAIVTGVNADGSIDVLESNGDGKGTVRTHTYPANVVANNVKGYYKPANYTAPNSGLTGNDVTLQSKLNNKFGQDITWNENGYIESLKTDFDMYLKNGKDAITKDQRAALKSDYNMSEKDFREMAQIYAKTGLKSEGVAQAETALASAIKLQEMLYGKDGTQRDNPQGGLFDLALQYIPFSDAGEAKAQFETLLSQLELNALFTAKNNGASFGAMSESEWDILGKSSTNLKWNSSTDTFQKNLQSLVNELSNVVSSGGGKLPAGLHNTDI